MVEFERASTDVASFHLQRRMPARTRSTIRLRSSSAAAPTITKIALPSGPLLSMLSPREHENRRPETAVPGVSKPALMISLCAACHAIVERLQAVRTWLSPRLLILWREQHPDAAYQLPLPMEPEDLAGGPALFHARSNHARFNPKVVELDR